MIPFRFSWRPLPSWSPAPRTAEHPNSAEATQGWSVRTPIQVKIEITNAVLAFYRECRPEWLPFGSPDSGGQVGHRWVAI